MSNFFDSNILLYALEYGSSKNARAKTLIDAGGTVSVQVLNEFIDVAKRKGALPLPDIIEALAALTDSMAVVPLTEEVHKRGVEIALATNFRIYDACIIAAAELSGCDVLYTEDMNHGQRVGRVTLRNPFMAA